MVQKYSEINVGDQPIRVVNATAPATAASSDIA